MTNVAKQDPIEHNARFLRALIDNLERVIRGKRKFLELLVTAFVAGGHVLIEDLPGLGKTTVAKTLARLVSADGGDGGDGSVGEVEGALTFSRIQFTPDLLPYDITGVDIFDPESKGFIFSAGPVFANVILADEINRTSPKVQSALLEVMAEGQVTVGTRTHTLDPLFFVIATQNPVEIEGTYPLSVAQSDRFFMRLTLGYPDASTEIEIVKDSPADKVLPAIDPVCDRSEILAARAAAEGVFCDDRLIEAVVGISGTTREHGGIELGVSPRGSLMLVRACRAYAMMQGRGYVVDQDIFDLTPAVLTHRLKIKDPGLDPVAFLREAALARLNEITY